MKKTLKFILLGGWPRKNYVEAEKIIGKSTDSGIMLSYAPYPEDELAKQFGEKVIFESSMLKKCGYPIIPGELNIIMKYDLFIGLAPK